MPLGELSGPAGRDLTLRQRKIIEVITDSTRRDGYPLTLREIGDAAGLASTSSVSHQLSVLAERGSHAPNALGNFCFDVTLGYRRLEKPRRAAGDWRQVR
jgi:SOS-response transcriptional repressor LexA